MSKSLNSISRISPLIAIGLRSELIVGVKESTELMSVRLVPDGNERGYKICYDHEMSRCMTHQTMDEPVNMLPSDDNNALRQIWRVSSLSS